MSWGVPPPEWPPEKTENPFEVYYRAVGEPARRVAGLYYRGAFLVSYTLGVFAVLLALLDSVTGSYRWLVGEVAAIAGVFWLVTWVRRSRWHSRTIDYRYLAEQFRVLRYLFPLGLTAPHRHMPAHHQHADVRASWMDWRLWAVLRQTSMHTGTAMPEYRGGCSCTASGPRIPCRSDRDSPAVPDQAAKIVPVLLTRNATRFQVTSAA